MLGEEMEEKEKRHSQIQEKLETLQASLERLERAIIILEERLESVLQLQTSNEVNRYDNTKEPVELVPLANQIKDESDKAQALINRVENLCGRVEL